MLQVLLSIGATVLVSWCVLVLVLLWARPSGSSLKQALRLLPDALLLMKRLATDRSLPTQVRFRIWFLLAYFAMPLDLVPDFIPVLGWADDVIIACLVLRSVVRRAGPDAVRRHWPGSAEGLEALWRAASLPGLPGAVDRDDQANVAVTKL